MKKIIFIICILLIVLGISGWIIYDKYFYDEYEVPKDVIINLNDNKFNVYEKHNSYELIDNINAKVISKDIELESDTVGTYTYTLRHIYKKKKYKYDISYQVVDIVKPVFISAPSTLTILLDEVDDLCKKIVYADNYDSIPKCLINGSYNKSIGTYNNLEYIITDSNGNENKKSFSLNIVSKLPKSNNNTKPKYLYMNDIIKNYKTDKTSIGIDVSKWQGKVDFKKVKDAGVEFVIMRIGSQRNPDDNIDMDIRFKEYYKAAKDVGLKIGVYVYNVAISPDDGRKVAKWVTRELNGDKLDLPIAYDFENWSKFMDYKISLHTLSESYKAFENELEKNGYDAMLYSSKFYLENVWMDYEDSNIWLAHYTSKTDYKGKYMLWQMTSLAKIDGITENTVDIDILYK